MSQNNIICLVEEYSEQLYRFVLRIVRDRDEALDLVQELFIKMLDRHLPQEKAARKAYLFQAAYNLALNSTRNRDRRRKNEQEQANHINFVSPGIDDDLQMRQEADLVHACLRELSPKQRQALSLRYFSDLTFEQIASVMQVANGTAKVHAARGLKQLRLLIVQKTDKERS